jgi:hypothetical protein
VARRHLGQNRLAASNSSKALRSVIAANCTGTRALEEALAEVDT